MRLAQRKRKPKTNQGFRRRGDKGTDAKYSYELYVQIGYKNEARTKPHRIYKTIRCRNDAEAQQELNKFALAVHSDNYIKPEVKTLQTFFHEWLTTYATKNLKHNSVENHKHIFKTHIAAKLGHIQLKDLKTLRLKDFIDQLDDHLAPATKRKIYNNLSSILNHAVKWQLLSKNPLSGVEPPKIPRKKVQIYGREQLESFLKCLQHAPIHWRMFYLFLLETGVRSSEAVALTWDKVNYIKNEVEISASAYHDSEDSKPESCGLILGNLFFQTYQQVSHFTPPVLENG